MKAGFDLLTLGSELDPLGLRLEENLGPAEIHARTDHYHAAEHFHYAKGVVA